VQPNSVIRGGAGLILALVIGLCAALQANGAQPQRKVVQIAYLSAGSPETHRHLAEAFVQGMNALGYVEGENLLINYRYAEGNYERLPALAAELTQMKPDLIVASTSASTRAAKHATATVPIVMVNVTDPIDQGFAASLARPGGNITGMSGQYEDTLQKMLELLHAAVPKASRIALLVNASQPVHANFLTASHDAAQRLGLELWLFEVQGPNDLDGAFAAIMQRHPDALMPLPDAMLFAEGKRIAAFGVKSRLPTIGAFREFAEVGGLMSYGNNPAESYKGAATYVDKILKGAKPGDLPIRQPTQFELVVNLKTAKALGITIPESVLIRADKVIR